MSYNRERFQANRYIIENKEGKDIAAMGGKELSRWAKDTAEAMVKGDRLKTHQLRNIYAAVNKLRTKFQNKSVTANSLLNELYLLMPQLAYAAGRQRAVNATLFPFMQAAIKAVDKSVNKPIDEIMNTTDKAKDETTKEEAIKKPSDSSDGATDTVVEEATDKKAVEEAKQKEEEEKAAYENTAFRNFFVLVESVVGFHKFFQENRSAEVNIV